VFKFKAGFSALIAVSLAGCSTDGEFETTGIRVTRSACPAVAIPAATGDVTLFNPPASRDAAAIDVVATITNLRSTCDETGENVVANATFDVLATRRNAAGAREVVLPYFAVVVQGANNVVAKRVSRVALRFNDGETRATAQGTATGQVLRSAATLPEDVRRQITRERKAGEADAAIDPLSDPSVRAAVQRATFELLVGFQLTQEQLAYNATR
jgi:predicted kinase